MASARRRVVLCTKSAVRMLIWRPRNLAREIGRMPSRYSLALGLSPALHILIAVALMGGPESSTTQVKAALGHTITAFIVAPAEDARFAGLNPVTRSDDAWMRALGDESSALQVGDVRIDVEKIRERGGPPSSRSASWR